MDIWRWNQISDKIGYISLNHSNGYIYGEITIAIPSYTHDPNETPATESGHTNPQRRHGGISILHVKHRGKKHQK